MLDLELRIIRHDKVTFGVLRVENLVLAENLLTYLLNLACCRRFPPNSILLCFPHFTQVVLVACFEPYIVLKRFGIMYLTVRVQNEIFLHLFFRIFSTYR